MKKRYVKPTVTVMNLNCEGALCTSARMRYSEPDEERVYNEQGNGTYY